MKKTWLPLAMLFSAAGLQAVNYHPAANGLQPVDRSGGSARALGMGSATAALEGGCASLWWNPAALGALDSPELAFHHLGGPVDSRRDTAAAGTAAGALGSLAAGLTLEDDGVFEGRDQAGKPAGSYTAGSFEGIAGWGRSWSQGFSLGISLRHEKMALAQTAYSSTTLGLGSLWSPWPGLRLGAACANLELSSDGARPQASLNLGSSYTTALGNTSKLLLCAAGQFSEGSTNLQLGVEDLLFNLFSLRLGCQWLQPDPKLNGLRGLSSGFGFKVRDFDVDYAYLPFGDLGGVQRLSLGWRFSRPAMVAPAKADPDGYLPDASRPYDGIVAGLYAEALRDREAGRFTQAAEKLSQALGLSPGQPQISRLLAEMTRRSASQPKQLSAQELVLQGEALLASKKLGDQAALSRRQEQARQWYNRGVDAWQSGEDFKARRHFARALKLKPRDPDTLQAIRKIDQKLADQKKGRQKEVGGLIKEARRLEGLGALEQALKLWDKVLFIDAGNPAALQARENLARQVRK